MRAFLEVGKLLAAGGVSTAAVIHGEVSIDGMFAIIVGLQAAQLTLGFNHRGRISTIETKIKNVRRQLKRLQDND